MYLYLEISLKPAVFSCLTNTIVPLPIALESCSNPQKISASFLVCNEKKRSVKQSIFGMQSPSERHCYSKYYNMICIKCNLLSLTPEFNAMSAVDSG